MHQVPNPDVLPRQVGGLLLLKLVRRHLLASGDDGEAGVQEEALAAVRAKVRRRPARIAAMSLWHLAAMLLVHAPCRPQRPCVDVHRTRVGLKIDAPYTMGLDRVIPAPH